MPTLVRSSVPYRCFFQMLSKPVAQRPPIPQQTASGTTEQKPLLLLLGSDVVPLNDIDLLAGRLLARNDNLPHQIKGWIKSAPQIAIWYAP
jgi:hypothetical protein